MSDAEFTHDVFLSHSAKDKAVVRPLAERLRKVGMPRFALRTSAFCLLPSLSVAIEGSLAHILCITWRPVQREKKYANPPIRLFCSTEAKPSRCSSG